MKKLFLSLMLLMASVMGMLAQSSLVATLNHNDTIISVYYGIDALKDAYSASSHGDVITLSSGRFNVPATINKNITLRGAGMEQDTVNRVAPTILIGDFNVYTQGGFSGNFTMEGIWHDGKIYFGNTTATSNNNYLSKAQFVKCRFNTFTYGNYGYSKIYDTKFVQCKIKQLDAHGDATFINCYVGAPGARSNSYRMNHECINCVVYGSLNPDIVNYSTFTNCILIGSSVMDETNTANNCIGIYTASTDTINNLFSDLPEIGLANVCYRSKKEVFKTFNPSSSDNWKDTDTYELQDSIRTKYLGTDGTEIGMYGGSFPFNPRNTLPKIKKFKVAPKSNAEGKLSVEIEVSAAGE